MNILLVDDEPDVLEPTALLLTEFGYACTPATGAAEALRLCGEIAFDMVVTDYLMPGVNGLELAREIRKVLPGATIVLLTAYGSTFYQRQEREPDVDAVVQKPVTVQHLLAVIRRLERQRRQPE